MNKQRVLDVFLEMVRIDSPSQHEAAMAAYCECALRDLGFDVRFDMSRSATGSDTNQIIAWREPVRGGAGALALTAHMDCVAPCEGIEPVVCGGVVRSAGDTILSADDKAGIAQILESIRAADERGCALPGIWVIFTVCEELGCVGAQALPADVLPPATPCLVMDADGPAGDIVVRAPEKWDFEATFMGRAAHAGVCPEDGLSAVMMASAAISVMELGRLDDETTANVGTITGGDGRNIVPAACHLVGECRSFNSARVAEVRDQLDAALHLGAAQFGGTVEVNWHRAYPAVNVSSSDPVIVAVEAAARAVGLEPHITSTGGGSDANIHAGRGVNAFCLGTGMTAFHTTDECITLCDLEGGAALLEEVLATWSVAMQGEAAE